MELQNPSKIERLALTIDESADALGLGKTSVYALLKTGQLRARRVAGRTLIERGELLRLLETSPDAREVRTRRGAVA